MKIDLNGSWQLYYHLEDGCMPSTPEEMESAGWPQIEAIVPGNVELDLVRAGIEEDPFYAENIYKYRKYEFYQWWFTRTFTIPADYEGSPCALIFEGLDTYADVFVNGVKVGEADNMFIAHEFDVTSVLNYGGENTLHVKIRSAINEAAKHEFPMAATGRYDEFTFIRKAPSSFGWDILCRLLSAGLWRGVYIEKRQKTRITEVYTATESIDEDGTANQIFRLRFTKGEPILDGYTLRVKGECGESVFSAQMTALFVSCGMTVHIPAAKLWWPACYGEQNLYNTTIELLKNGEIVDSKQLRVGIRKFHIEHAMKPGDEGEFRIECNGVPILAKGSNWVPLDALHSRDAERYDAALALFKDTKCNIVRCWGGNVYEDHRFFDLCDEYGIMVWQDFAMACQIYSATDELREALTKEATAVVKKLRNHPSLLLWAGDNECDETISFRGEDFYYSGYPTLESQYNPLTREVLSAVVRMHDPYRFYLPSSPYIANGINRYEAPEQHNWGARAYFKDDFYKHTKAHFISECGYHGCPAVSSLKKYIPEDQLVPWLGRTVWKTHNTDYLPIERGYNRIQLMTDQVEIFFGGVPEDLLTFSHLSQIVQAEAKKFFIERTRIKKWRRTGIIWWNMLDGWPQISDAVVDYYFAKKLAYHYIKRVQEPICLMMDELVDWNHAVVLGNDSCQTKTVAWRVEDGDNGEVLLRGETLSKANENVTVGSIRELSGTQKLYILRWTVDGKEYANHFLSGFPHFNAEQVLRYVDIIKKLPEQFDWED